MRQYVNGLKERFHSWEHDQPIKASLLGAGLNLAALGVVLGVGFVSVTQGILPYFEERAAAQQLQEYNRYCSELEEAAEDDDTKKFVRTHVKIPEGWHKGKTCGEVMDEYSELELIE